MQLPQGRIPLIAAIVAIVALALTVVVLRSSLARSENDLARIQQWQKNYCYGVKIHLGLATRTLRRELAEATTPSNGLFGSYGALGIASAAGFCVPSFDDQSQIHGEHMLWAAATDQPEKLLERLETLVEVMEANAPYDLVSALRKKAARRDQAPDEPPRERRERDYRRR